MFFNDCSPSYGFDDYLFDDSLLEFLKGKSKKQTVNFLRLIAPNSRKKDRGHQKEKYYKFAAEKRQQQKEFRNVLRQVATEKSDTPAGQALGRLIAFSNYLGMGF